MMGIDIGRLRGERKMEYYGVWWLLESEGWGGH